MGLFYLFQECMLHIYPHLMGKIRSPGASLNVKQNRRGVRGSQVSEQVQPRNTRAATRAGPALAEHSATDPSKQPISKWFQKKLMIPPAEQVIFSRKWVQKELNFPLHIHSYKVFHKIPSWDTAFHIAEILPSRAVWARNDGLQFSSCAVWFLFVDRGSIPVWKDDLGNKLNMPNLTE